ncbi:MAG: ABC transporter ATP-binding protein [Burkholderiaceae bacterium]|jgi:branched-chain amino acid transport system ATP-binding protein
MLKVDGLGASYGDLQVLWNVSIHVDSGELVAIVGPNGAGKSTLINTLSGLVTQRDGSIHLDGVSIHTLSAEDRVAIGVIQCPEGRKLFPEMTVDENLRIGAYLCSDGREVRRRIDHVYSVFPKLEQRSKQIASTMSGGEQQMVAIGRSLMGNPKLLLLDEPSLGLAPIMVSEMFQAIEKIKQDGTTILIVEQNVSQTLSISDRAYVLENGQIGLTGVAKDLLNDPHMRKAYLGLD